MMGRYRLLLAVVAILTAGLVGWLVAGDSEPPQRREFHIVARQYAYEPHRIVVGKGDEVHITLSSRDVTHGFFLEGHDLDAVVRGGETGIGIRHPSTEKEYRPAEEIVFTANKSGKFRFRCSHTCGYLHPFMQGEMIVTPNRLLPVGVGLVVGMLGAGLICAWPVKGDGGDTALAVDAEQETAA